MGEYDSPQKENLMPGVMPPARGGRRQPGQLGGVAPRAARPVSDDPPAAGAAATGAAAVSMPDGTLRAGQEFEVTVEDVAQGGWCVARPDGLPVMFVRHALPGERVVARVTEVTSKFTRADAVTILQASPDRVVPPCPNAHPGGCGGCDWQHASLPAQRALKGAVISQQLRRLAGIEREVTVEPLPGDGPAAAGAPAPPAADGTPGLGWRTRVQFTVSSRGVAGLRAHRSHEVIDIGDCPIAHPSVRALDVTGDNWSGATAVEVAVGGADSTENFALTVVEDSGDQRSRHQTRNGKNQAGRNGRGRPSRPRRTLVEGRPYLAEQVAGRIWQVSADGFWQVHPAAAGTLSTAVVDALEPRAGDTVIDLYCGAGLFAGAIAPLVGPDGSVTGIEADPGAVKNARQNLGDYPWATFQRADVAQAVTGLAPARLVVADPPRAGLAREVIDWLNGAPAAKDGAAKDSAGESPAADGAPADGAPADGSPAERFAYVSCDPATLARDLALLTAGGWRLENLRAFDAFPMTHHVECVATLSRGPGPGE
jgi:tRNA/tmRNA/rRNA uracil-C5-methylase (TrmA/RlmC/RlmD family)